MLFIYEPASDSLVAVGTSIMPMGERQHALGLNRLPLTNGGRAADVFQSGEPYRNGHLESDLAELRGIREGLGVRSCVTVPMVIDEVRRGVVRADSSQPEAFSDVDASFLGARGALGRPGAPTCRAG
jgi:hypothetical protein